jgi:hypothetical protein
VTGAVVVTEFNFVVAEVVVSVATDDYDMF